MIEYIVRTSKATQNKATLDYTLPVVTKLTYRRAE